MGENIPQFQLAKGRSGGNPSEARRYVEAVRQLRTHGNLKSIAISESNLSRLANKPEIAWPTMEWAYVDSRKTLLSAKALHDLSYGDLVHNFACLFIGAFADRVHWRPYTLTKGTRIWRR